MTTNPTPDAVPLLTREIAEKLISSYLHSSDAAIDGALEALEAIVSGAAVVVPARGEVVAWTDGVNLLSKTASFQAMQKFALAVANEPPEQVRAALCWMLDFHRDFTKRAKELPHD